MFRSLAIYLGLCLISWGAVPTSAAAGEVQVAAAANFTEPAREIAKAFTDATGHHVVLSFGASGQFDAQIGQGAPFEVFLSADAEHPEHLERLGLAVPGSRFTYALGALVLYSATPGRADPAGQVLAKGDFDRLAIADPAAAPYGRAAVETLQRLKLYDRLKDKLVKGANITQAFQFVDSGAAELGFVALSQVINRPGGSRWRVPAAIHAPIEQQAVLLRLGAGNGAARAFLAFLKGPTARAIMERYGYQVP